jgi:hypothetical protein
MMGEAETATALRSASPNRQAGDSGNSGAACEDYTSTTAGAPTERWKRRRSVLAERAAVIASKNGCSLASAEADVLENFFKEDKPEPSM